MKKHLERDGYLASILENSVDAIVLLDKNNRIQVWNKGAERIFGFTAEEMIGETFYRIIPHDQDPVEEMRQINEAVFEHGYIENYTAPRLTKDGRRIIVSLSRTLVRDAGGEPIGSTVIIRDVTEQMELDQRIYHTEKLASIGILAAGVAHEINNPLSIILGFTDLLLEGKSPDDPEYEDLKTIEYNANNAKEIISRLLGFARVSEGHGEDRVDVRQAVETVIGVVGYAIDSKNINLQLDFPDTLPETRGDPREFQQVVLNLLNNAIAAVEEEDGLIRISAEVDRGWVKLHVRDNGCGIPREIRQRIFDPFFTTKEAGDGTGLGLSLCYGIVKKMGGKITLRTVSHDDYPESESWTRFTVHLPVKEKGG